MDIQTLKRRDQFQRVFAQGRRAASGGLSVFAAPNHLGENRYGLVATTKAGCAVKRNKLRRWMREFLRDPDLALKPGWDVIIHTNKPQLAVNYEQFTSCLTTAFADSQVSGDANVR